MAEKEAVLVVCPGRGTYGKAELGYLKRHHADKAEPIGTFDRIRAERGQPTVSELDGAERFQTSLHTRGDVASPLIFACSFADFLAIDRSRFEVAAVIGNSMGWYSALAVGGAVGAEDGFRIIDAMGGNSQAHARGGQLLLTVVGDDWRPVPGLREAILDLVAAIGARPGHARHLSIDLGGMLVLAGDEAGLAALLDETPPTPGRAPMRLAGHGPFHTPLMRESSERARAALAAGLVDRLEADKLVERVSDPNDRRSVRAALTAEGLRRHAEGVRILEEVEREVFAKLGEAERDLLERLVQLISPDTAPTPPPRS